MTDHYYRPLLQTGTVRPNGALQLAGGWCWFETVEVLSRSATPRLIAARDLPDAVSQRLTGKRLDVAGLSMSTPQIMGILNTTPDSFSDGGEFSSRDAAIAHAMRMIADGASLIDVGGESTRPGADYIPPPEEIARIEPVVAHLAQQREVVISIDTRKASVAQAAINAGAHLINDVSAFTHDTDMAQAAATSGVPVCLMHAQGDPVTMQNDPSYDDVVLDVYDFLSDRIEATVSAGVKRDKIIVDPGIGFGKKIEHNLALLRNLSLFHSLGCPVLLGASRKRFIGTLGNAPEARDRMPGSVAVALHGVNQGVQMLRVHDTFATKQALNLHMAMIEAGSNDT